MIRSKLSLLDAKEENLVNNMEAEGFIDAEINLNFYGIEKFKIPAAFLPNDMVTPKVRIVRSIQGHWNLTEQHCLLIFSHFGLYRCPYATSLSSRCATRC